MSRRWHEQTAQDPIAQLAATAKSLASAPQRSHAAAAAPDRAAQPSPDDR
jgi:hypothetical protein